jgi:fluoroacetyl-CoA thioesterase
VGYGFEFKHLAPTAVGDTVIATAEITAIEKNFVTLHIEARDSADVISRGTHIRAVIEMERFLKRLKRKTPS